MHKWGLVSSVNCRYGAEEQMADHILAFCPLYHPPNGTLGWRLSMITLFTGLKQLYLASDDKSA